LCSSKEEEEEEEEESSRNAKDAGRKTFQHKS
jgi:hypothetical protein